MVETTKMLGCGLLEMEQTASTIGDIYSKSVESHSLFIKDEIDSENATHIAASMIYLSQKDPSNEITIYINSIGGTIFGGLLTIYDTMQAIQAPIRTFCIGEAYSSAAIIMASGTPGRRFLFPNSKVMIHAIQLSDVSGSSSELEREMKRIKIENKALMEIIARHTGQPLNKVKRDCKEDYYLNAEEAIKYGLADEIASPIKKIPNLSKISRAIKKSNIIQTVPNSLLVNNSKNEQ